MKTIFTTILFVAICKIAIYAQITFQGCAGVLGAQNYVLSQTGTTNDGGVIRNTFEATPNDFAQSCPAGVCELRIIWNITLDRSVHRIIQRESCTLIMRHPFLILQT